LLNEGVIWTLLWVGLVSGSTNAAPEPIGFYGPGRGGVIPYFDYTQTVSNGLLITGSQLDVAIKGDGWFELRDPGTDARYFTRMGEFSVDMNGYVRAMSGHRVQGVTNILTKARGDVRIRADAGAGIASFGFLEDGTLRVRLLDASEVDVAQLTLASPGNGQVLRRVARGVFEVEGNPASMVRVSASDTNSTPRLHVGAQEIVSEPTSLRMLRNRSDRYPASEGVIVGTGIATDLAIVGPGFFLVREVSTGELFATRAGMFREDGEGYLVTYDRKRVQAAAEDVQSAPRDIRVRDVSQDGTKHPVAFFNIDALGRIAVRRRDGSDDYLPERIGLYEFRSPSSLQEAKLGQLRGVADAGPRLTTQLSRLPESRPFGRDYQVLDYGSGIRGGALEMVNVPTALLELRRTSRMEVQGAIERSATNSHLAISGPGYFLVRDPVGGETYARRRGDFQLDAENYLVSPEGFRVQGLADVTRTRAGDIQVDGAGRPSGADPAATVQSWVVSRDGTVTVRLTDGTEFVRGRVMLQQFREGYMLRQLPSGLLSNLGSAYPETAMSSGYTLGLGLIEHGALEIEPEPEVFPAPSPEGVPRLQILSENHSRIRIQVTTDFRSWETVADILNPMGEMEWADLNAGKSSHRIYRVVPVTD
jgi:flagellar hook protein FlgE